MAAGQEKRAAAAARWREANPDYARKWREANRDRINALRRARRVADPEKYRKHGSDHWHRSAWSAQLKKKYGITADHYEQMMSDQDGKCALCGRVGNVGGKRLAVDHCHATGRVRGLLCNTCNTMLDNAQDNVDLLMSAAAYILSNQNLLEVC